MMATLNPPRKAGSSSSGFQRSSFETKSTTPFVTATKLDPSGAKISVAGYPCPAVPSEKSAIFDGSMGKMYVHVIGVNVGNAVVVEVGIKDGKTSGILVSDGIGSGTNGFSFNVGRTVTVVLGVEIGEGCTKMDPGMGEQPARINPNINSCLFISQIYEFLSKFSRSGISSAARRSISNAVPVSKSRRLAGTGSPVSANSITFMILPRKPLARLAQCESTESRSSREASKRKSSIC
jgi:hypothetical protein